MEAVTALFSKAAAAGRWALGMLELGVTVPLDTPERLPARVVDVLDEPEGFPLRVVDSVYEPHVGLDVEYHPVTGLPMLAAGIDVTGNPTGVTVSYGPGEYDCRVAAGSVLSFGFVGIRAAADGAVALASFVGGLARAAASRFTSSARASSENGLGSNLTPSSAGLRTCCPLRSSLKTGLCLVLTPATRLSWASWASP